MTLSEVWETDPKTSDRGRDPPTLRALKCVRIIVCVCMCVCPSPSSHRWHMWGHLHTITFLLDMRNYTHTLTHTERWIGLVWCPCQMSGCRWDEIEGGRSRLFPFFSHTSTYTHRHTPVLPLRCPVTKRVVSRSVGSLNCLTSARKLPKHVCMHISPTTSFQNNRASPNDQHLDTVITYCSQLPHTHNTHTPQEK